jgi:hypothetical protein
MTKLDLQKELLEKIKPGTKPSDLKKDREKPAKIPVSPSPIEISQEPRPKPLKKPLQSNEPEKDEGYQSDPLLTPTPSEDGYSSEEENPKVNKNQDPSKGEEEIIFKTFSDQEENLQKQIKTLQTQLQLYKDFKEADLKIKERQKKQIEQLTRANSNLTAGMDRLTKLNQQLNKSVKELQTKLKEKDKTISDLKNQAKPTAEIKEEKTKTFYCNGCQQNKTGTPTLRKIDSPFEPRTHKKLCYLCPSCLPYTKEYNEKENWKDQDNPYKLYD